MFILSANQLAACCPVISLKPPGTIMDSISEYRAYFSLIIDYGNCTEAIARNSTFELVIIIIVYLFLCYSCVARCMYRAPLKISDLFIEWIFCLISITGVAEHGVMVRNQNATPLIRWTIVRWLISIRRTTKRIRSWPPTAMLLRKKIFAVAPSRRLSRLANSWLAG